MPTSHCPQLLCSTHAAYADKRREQEYVPGSPEEQQTRRLAELDANAGRPSQAEQSRMLAVQSPKERSEKRGSNYDGEGSSGPKRPQKGRTMWVRHDFIYQVEFFKQCDARFVDRILPGLDARLYLPGQVVIREGDEGNSMSIIHRGRTEISVQGHKVAELSDGACFGEIAVLGISSLRIATVRAIQMCDVRTLSRLHFLRVLSEFPLERQRFKEMARKRAVATEGAAEQMQYRRQQRRLNLRHAIAVEKAIFMGGLRLAKAQSISGDSSSGSHESAMVDAYDARPGYQDMKEGDGGDDPTISQEHSIDKIFDDAGGPQRAQSSSPRRASGPSKYSSPDAGDKLLMAKREMMLGDRKQYRIQEVACALQKELKRKGKLMLKYSQDLAKDLRRKDLKNQGTRGVAEAVFDHISNPEKELSNVIWPCSPSGSVVKENADASPTASPKLTPVRGMASPRRGAIQGNRELVTKIQESIAENDELGHIVNMNQWAEEHRRKLEHAKRIKAAAEARIPKTISYVLGLGDGHSLPEPADAKSVTGGEQAPASLDSTFFNTSLSMDKSAYSSLNKRLYEEMYAGAPEGMRLMASGSESPPLESKSPSEIRPPSKQTPRARKGIQGKTSPLQMQKLQAQSRIFRAATPSSRRRPGSVPPGVGVPMELSYESWIRDGAQSALASISKEGTAGNRTLSPENSVIAEATKESRTWSPEDSGTLRPNSLQSTACSPTEVQTC